jgi:hypothetical protein
MKAELVLMGKRLDMAPRAARRWLVATIYMVLAAVLVELYLLDHWRTSGYYLIFATFLVNRFLLGGYQFGGLVKPFNERAPVRRVTPVPFVLLFGLRVWEPEPRDSELRNDEREQAQRDHAHFQAYQALIVALAPMWLLAAWAAGSSRLLAWLRARLPMTPMQLIYGLVLATIAMAITLPQSILLWTEPDMEEAEGE